MTDTQTGFYAEGAHDVAPTPAQWFTRPPATTPRPYIHVSRHTVARPGEIDAALAKLAGYRTECDALADTEASPTIARRTKALTILVGEAEHDVDNVIASHAEGWAEDLRGMCADLTTEVDHARDVIAEDEPVMVHAARVIAWLYRRPGEHVNYLEVTGRTLHRGEEPAKIATWFLGDVHPQPDEVDAIRHTVATLRPHAVIASLLRPDELEEPYAEHRRLVERYEKLTRLRELVEDQRSDADEADTHLLADAIRNGDSSDVGTPNADEIDTKLADIDRQRADLLPRIQTTFATVTGLVDKHRAQWLADLVDHGASAAQRWTTATLTVVDNTKAIAGMQTTLDWLATIDPIDDEEGGDAA